MIVRVDSSKRGKAQLGAMPLGHAPELAVSLVDSPDRAEVPVEVLADDLEDPGIRLVERIDLGQNTGRGVLGRLPPLVVLAPGEIVKDHQAALNFPLVVPQRAGVDQHPRPLLQAGMGDEDLDLIERFAADGPKEREFLGGVSRGPVGMVNRVQGVPGLQSRVGPAPGRESARRPG